MHMWVGAQPDTHTGGCRRHSRALPSPVGTAHVCAGARGHGHACAGVGGQGPTSPLASLCCCCPGCRPWRRAWVSWGAPGPAETSPSRGAPAAALPAPHRAVMNGSGGSSGTRARLNPSALSIFHPLRQRAEPGPARPRAPRRAGTARGPAFPHRGATSPMPPRCPHPHGQDTLGDSARTRDPPASPWDAQHGQSGLGVGAPPMPCLYPATSPSTTMGTGGAGDGATGGTWGARASGYPPASPPRHCGHTRCQPLPSGHRHRMPWLRAVGLRHGHGAGTGQDATHGEQGDPRLPVPSPAPGCGDAGNRSAPGPGDGGQGHTPHSTPWCGEGAGTPVAPQHGEGQGRGAEPGLNPPPAPPCHRMRPTHGSSGYK